MKAKIAAAATNSRTLAMMLILRPDKRGCEAGASLVLTSVAMESCSWLRALEGFALPDRAAD
jgi:hypothetical protein